MSINEVFRSTEGMNKILETYGRLIKKWPVPYEELTVETPVGQTNIIVSGPKESPPLILLHGTASNALAWMGDIEAYSRHFRVYAPDIPGEPGRSETYRASMKDSSYIRWMEAIFEALKIDVASMVGLSQGGWIALKFSVNRSEKIKKLVLLTPGGVVPPKISFMLRAIPLSLLGKFGSDLLNSIVIGDAEIGIEAVSFMNTITANFKPRIDPQPMFKDPELKMLKMPLQLLAGEKDPIIPSLKVAKRLKGLVTKLYPEILKDTGHILKDTTNYTIPFLMD